MSHRLHTLENALATMTAQLSKMAEDQAKLAATIEDTRKQIVATGTRDVTEDAARAIGTPAPPADPRPQSPAARLEIALRHGPVTLERLTEAVPRAKMMPLLRQWQREGRVCNLGTDLQPRLMWVVGDDSQPHELQAAIERLLRDRPMTFQQLIEATGARRARVSGCIVQLQRTGAKIVNLGTPTRAIWSLQR